jgi:hypothetical protein
VLKLPEINLRDGARISFPIKSIIYEQAKKIATQSDMKTCPIMYIPALVDSMLVAEKNKAGIV